MSCADRNTEALWDAYFGAGVDPNARTANGYTLLHEAARQCRTSDVPMFGVLAKMAGAKEQLDVQDIFGWTPLHWAAHEGHASVIMVLLDAGAKPDVRDEEGKTPFDVISSELEGTEAYWKLHEAQYR